MLDEFPMDFPVALVHFRMDLMIFTKCWSTDSELMSFIFPNAYEVLDQGDIFSFFYPMELIYQMYKLNIQYWDRIVLFYL